jgi:hypothetical protein
MTWGIKRWRYQKIENAGEDCREKGEQDLAEQDVRCEGR